MTQTGHSTDGRNQTPLTPSKPAKLIKAIFNRGTFMANPNAIPMVPQSATQSRWKRWLQRGIVGAITLFFLYIVLVMYSQNEPIFALVTLLFATGFAFIFTSERAYVWRYVFPGLAGMMLFIVFPIIYTLGISFTNYSNLHLIDYSQARTYFLNQTYMAEGGGTYDLSLYEQGSDYRIALTAGSDNQLYVSQDAVPLTNTEQITLQMEAVEFAPELNEAPRTAAIKLRGALDQVRLELPDGTALFKSRLTQFAPSYPLWEPGEGDTLVNQQDGTVIAPNFETGYFETRDGTALNPGFTVGVGVDNFTRVLTDRGMFDPFLQIFTWTMSFSSFTVIICFVLGLTLASLVQWEPIRGRTLYQVLLILPYALPSFISIMIFRALFNQNFGEINFILGSLFGISPDWNSNPNLTRGMILFVNCWLGYPYMFILCLGMLQSIPKDLYEASGIEGSGMINNFFRITLPLILKPMLPLLIAAFAFNFNNFVLIELLTKGGPIMIGSNPPAGETDLLVNYAYRLAFRGDSQDFALASTISTFIFIMVGIIAYLYLKVTKVEVGRKRS